MTGAEWIKEQEAMEAEESTAEVSVIELDGEGGTTTVNSFEEADTILQMWASKESPSGGYCKTWYTVIATDGSTYKGRVDLLHRYSIKSDILQGEMAQYLNFLISGKFKEYGYRYTEQDVADAKEALKFWGLEDAT
jgi:hypothetical protein